MGLQGIERRLERLVEGVFARAFRAELRPVELGRRVLREMDLHCTVGVRGEKVAPNHHVLHLAPADLARLEPFLDSLLGELADAVEQHATDERYQLKGPAVVEILEDPHQHPGQFTVASAIVAGLRTKAPLGWLELPDRSRVPLHDDAPVVIGRMPECEITVNDPNVSRRHAEVRAIAGRATVADLDSLNGTRVNGKGVPADHYGVALAHGDLVSVGGTVLRYVSAEAEGHR